MQIEDFIYDAAVLKMGVCLERFLKLRLKTKSTNLKRLINKFCTGRDDKIRDWMHDIRAFSLTDCVVKTTGLWQMLPIFAHLGTVH